MSITIRRENENDYAEVENLTREAFWNMYRPGCVEHLIVNKLRKVLAFIYELDLVAISDDRIVGHIIYSKAKVVDKDGMEYDVICFGPISVLPPYQNRGIGSALIERTISIAKDLGYKGIIIYGDPDYYHRFGFKNAGRFGITTAEGANFEAFMALEVYKGSLKGVTGKFQEDQVYKVDEVEVEEFEKRFPYKEKGAPKIIIQP